MKNRIMKLTVTTFVLALIFSTASMAQRGQGGFQKAKGDKPTPEERAQRMTENMTKNLELNDYQSDQIGKLNASLTQDLSSLEESGLEKEEKKAAAKEIRDNYNVQVSDILDEEQNEKFLKSQERRKEKRGGKKGGKGKRGQDSGTDGDL